MQIISSLFSQPDMIANLDQLKAIMVIVIVKETNRILNGKNYKYKFASYYWTNSRNPAIYLHPSNHPPRKSGSLIGRR